MANGEDTPVDPAEVAMVKVPPQPRRASRGRKSAKSESAPSNARASGAQTSTVASDRANEADDQDSLAKAADHLAMQLGVVPNPGADEALSAGRRVSRAAIRTHRLIVEFHLGQLDRTLRAGRALTTCRSFEDALEVHRSFMQETLRASASHLRELTDLGVGAVVEKSGRRSRA